jgi:hypothetical protein
MRGRSLPSGEYPGENRAALAGVTNQRADKGNRCISLLRAAAVWAVV